MLLGDQAASQDRDRPHLQRLPCPDAVDAVPVRRHTKERRGQPPQVALVRESDSSLEASLRETTVTLGGIGLRVEADVEEIRLLRRLGLDAFDDFLVTVFPYRVGDADRQRPKLRVLERRILCEPRDEPGLIELLVVTTVDRTVAVVRKEDIGLGRRVL